MEFDPYRSYLSKPPLARWLIAIIVASFLVGAVVRMWTPWSLDPVLGLVPLAVLERKWVWQVFTHPFIESSVMGFLFKTYMFWILSGPVASGLGSRRFLTLCSVCTLVGAGLATALHPASMFPFGGLLGVVAGLIVAEGIMYAEEEVLFFFVVRMKIKHFALLAAVLIIVFDRSFLGLGGLAGAFVYMSAQKWRLQVRNWVGARSHQRTVRRAPPVLHELGSEVDRILDKISRKGLDSLTRDERELMERYSRSKR